MKTKLKKGILIVAVACLAVVAGYYIRQNSHVRFADENMGIVICNTIGNGVTPETVRYKDLENITELRTSYLGYYTTLKDIKKCPNIEMLSLNDGCMEYEPCYDITHNVVGEMFTDSEVKRVEEELMDIVPKLKKLNKFVYTDYYGNCTLTNWKFLQGSKNLEEIWIDGLAITDYSFLCGFRNLKLVMLQGSRVETADSLLNLQNPQRLCIFDTPLAENEEEVQRLCEALPNTEILVEPGRVEHKSDIPWWKDTD